jgi:hypothetical protein
VPFGGGRGSERKKDRVRERKRERERERQVRGAVQQLLHEIYLRCVEDKDVWMKKSD